MIRRAAAIAFAALAALARAQEPAPAPTPAPDVLVQDPTAISAWRGVREQLAARMAQLRSACERRDDGGVAAVARASQAMRADMEEFVDLAKRLAPEELAEIEDVRGRIDRLLENLAADRDGRNWVQATATLRILEDSVGRLEGLADESDRRVGRRASSELARVPPDWGDAKHPEPGVRVELVLMDARALRTAIAARRRDLAEQTRQRLRDEHLRVAGEVGEMARALVARQGEVPALSRPGFVHAALRIDVIADNLAACHAAGDRLAFRRQLMLLGDALDDISAYLNIASAIAEPGP